MLVNLSQLAKAFFPISVNPSGRVTLVKLTQVANAPPMSVTLLGTSIVVKLLQFWNAEVSEVTPLGISTAFRPKQE